MVMYLDVDNLGYVVNGGGYVRKFFRFCNWKYGPSNFYLTGPKLRWNH